jgi:hypothetical protein
LSAGGVGAAAVLAIASALPWESAITIAGAHDVSGLEHGGAVTLPLALLAAGLLAAAHFRGWAWCAVAAALAGLGAAVLAGRDLARLASGRHDIIDAGSFPAPGVGLAMAAGAALAGFAAVAAWRGRPPRSPKRTTP